MSNSVRHIATGTLSDTTLSLTTPSPSGESEARGRWGEVIEYRISPLSLSFYPKGQKSLGEKERIEMF
jgi:hypothetical protein